MSRVSASGIVAAPLDRVWAAFADLTGRQAWVSDVESVEVLSPRTDHFEVGTAWRETRVDRAGHATTEKLVVLEIEPGRRCVLGLAGVGGSPRLTYTFVERRGTTVVQVIMDAPDPRPRRLADRLLEFTVRTFAARTTEGALRDELERLARHVGATPVLNAA